MTTAEPEPGTGRRGGALQFAGLAISVVCVGAVVWWALQQPAPELPTSAANLGALGAAIALYALNTALRAERWIVLLRDQGARPARSDAYALTVVGYMGNNVLPARGGDVLRVVLAAPRAATGRRTVIGTLLAERLLDVAVLGVLFVVLAITVAGGAGLPEGRTLVLLVVLAAAAAAGAAVALAVLVRRGLWERVRAFLAPVLASTGNLRGRHGAGMLALTLVIWCVEAGVWGVAGAAADLDMGPLEALYLVALASMFSLIPSGPGYAGTQDAAAIIGARAIGATSAQALSYVILVRFVLLVPITLAGLVLATTRYGGLRRLRAA